MNKEDKKILRGKSFQVTAGEVFHTTVINAAAFLTIHAVEIASASDQPSVEAMRSPIMPAYRVIAEAMSEFLKDKDITAERLTALEVNLMAYLGKYEVAVKYNRPDGKVQPYVIKVMASDGRNVFLRMREKVGLEAAQVFVDKI
jgi:hypothetical protein